MLTQNQKDLFREIEKDVKERDKYLDWIPIVQKLAFTVIGIGFLTFIVASFFRNTSIQSVFLVAFLIFFVLWMTAEDVLPKLAKKKTPSTDKLTLYHTLAAIHNIECYFNPVMADKEEEKKKFKSDICENVRALLSIIERNWYVGDFKLGTKILGNVTSTFKERLSKRLVPNIEKGADSFLEKAESVLYNFAIFLDNPTIKALEHINSMMDDVRDITVTQKQNIWASFKQQPIHVRLIVAVGIATITIPIVVYYVGLTYFQSSIGDAFNTSVVIAVAFAVLFVAELISILKSREVAKLNPTSERTNQNS